MKYNLCNCNNSAAQDTCCPVISLHSGKSLQYNAVMKTTYIHTYSYTYNIFHQNADQCVDLISMFNLQFYAHNKEKLRVAFLACNNIIKRLSQVRPLADTHKLWKLCNQNLRETHTTRKSRDQNSELLTNINNNCPCPNTTQMSKTKTLRGLLIHEKKI